MRLQFTEQETELLTQADQLEQQAKALREQAFNIRTTRELARPLADRLVYAATARCPCGHGMAYDPTGEVASDKSGPFRLPDAWECAGILLHKAGELDPAELERMKPIQHEGALPFACYDIKCEDQPSANGATTRGSIVPKPA